MENHIKVKKKNKYRRYLPLYIMLIPGLIYLIINNYIPMGGLIIAFKRFNYAQGIFDSPFVGLNNFKFLFSGSDSFLIIRNTVLYNAVFIVLGTILSVVIAIMLNSVRQKFLKKTYQTIILIPYLISIVIVSSMAFAFFSQDKGLINNALNFQIGWYSEPSYWPFILTFIYLWKNAGYTAIIYYTSILSIDPSLYEAAKVDGATGWGIVKNVILPSIKPTIITMVLLLIGRIFYSDFGLFYQVPMNSGPLINATSTIDTYVYRALTSLNDVGRASAAGFVQSILGFILVFAANHIVNKIDKDSALF